MQRPSRRARRAKQQALEPTSIALSSSLQPSPLATLTAKERTPTTVLLDIFSRFPGWMSETYHVLHILSVLELFAKVPCGLAPVMPGSYWMVIRGGNEWDLWLARWEYLRGRNETRSRYNRENLMLVQRTLASEMTELNGLNDLFVPIVRNGVCEAALVAGSFQMKPPTADDIMRRWVALGGKADPYDRDLIDYARAMLNVQVFEPEEFAAFRELLESLGRGLAGTARLPDELARVNELRRQVFGRMARSRQWKAYMMLDSMANAEWPTGELQGWEQAELAIGRMPDAVIAVMPERGETRVKDSISALVEAHHFQRRAAEISRRFEDTLSAPLEDYGAYFVFALPERKNPANRRLALLERARQIAATVERELGVRLTVGIGGLAAHAAELPTLARQATIAMQLAVHQDVGMLAFDECREERSAQSASQTPASYLAGLVELFATGMFTELETRQADYVRAVLWESGGRIGRIRTQLSYALDALLARLEADHGIDARTSADLRSRLHERLEQAASSASLANGFHDSVAMLVRATGTPSQSQLELKLARAARFIEEHCNRPLTLGGVARHVGLSKTYFCERFRQSYGSGFAEQLRRARVERAKHLLRFSPLPIQRIGHESGFVSVPHFNRAFKEVVGLTPTQFRAKHRVRGRAA